MTEREDQVSSTEEEEPKVQNDTDESEEETDESGKPKSKIKKAINKQKKKVEKKKKEIRHFLNLKLQILLFILLIPIVLSWPIIEKVLHKLSYQEQITVIEKTTEHMCYGIITQDYVEVCVDAESYENAYVGNQYMLVDLGTYYELRKVR